MSMAAMQKSMGDLFRRSAVVAMARASAVYQPSSADDAAAVRASVCGLLDAEILVAGAQYEDATYAALRALRVAVSSDLTARGAGLAPLTTIKTNSPMPALALAQRVYRDPARSDELILESNSIHPAFMKTRFKALSQ
jgi:prophage DNA circulation protein